MVKQGFGKGIASQMDRSPSEANGPRLAEMARLAQAFGGSQQDDSLAEEESAVVG